MERVGRRTIVEDTRESWHPSRPRPVCKDKSLHSSYIFSSVSEKKEAPIQAGASLGAIGGSTLANQGA